MNIFFLHFHPQYLASLYCDQHVVKILLEICQMLYTAWYFSDEMDFVYTNAPHKKNSDERGYKKAHTGHPMTMWVGSSKENYKYTTLIGMALAIEHNKRFGTVHSCTKHILWLHNNIPSNFKMMKNEKAYYCHNVPSGITPIPLCMPDAYKCDNVLKSYRDYYIYEKLAFARWKGK